MDQRHETGADEVAERNEPLLAVGPPAQPAIETPAPAPAFPGRYAVALLLASIAASVMVVPFSLALLRQEKTHQIPEAMLPIVLGMEVLIETALAAVAIVVGLRLGVVGRVGLGWPPIAGWDDPAGSPERARRLRAAVAWALVMAAASALIIMGLEWSMRGNLGEDSGITMPPWHVNLIASVGAGIREEVWLRLGAMTFFAWLAAKSAGQRPAGPTAQNLGNLVACLLFAAMHLPQAAMLLGLTPAVVAFVMLANGLPGLLFGWLYARHGLLAAMLSHAVVDILLKVVLPLVS